MALAIRETGGQIHRCRSSQDCENASIPTACSEKSFDQNWERRRFRSDANASRSNRPQAEEREAKALSEIPS